MWKRVSGYDDGYVPRSLLEQHIVSQGCYYQWHGGEPDAGQLPEGYRQLARDKYRARRTLSRDDKRLLQVVVALAACVAVLVVRSL